MLVNKYIHPFIKERRIETFPGWDQALDTFSVNSGEEKEATCEDHLIIRLRIFLVNFRHRNIFLYSVKAILGS